MLKLGSYFIIYVQNIDLKKINEHTILRYKKKKKIFTNLIKCIIVFIKYFFHSNI